jgi:hypothetical protein
MILDVGAVMEMARVEINGQDLGVVWCPPWRVAVPPGLLKASDNQLVITVANTWNNRLFVDSKLPDKDRLTQCRAGGNGLQPAGLLGPVVLRTGIPMNAKPAARKDAARVTVAAKPRASRALVPAGAPDAENSTLSVSPSMIPADGSAAATITVTLRDARGNPVPGKAVTLVSSRGAKDVISTASGPSRADGVVTFSATSATIGSAVLRATADKLTPALTAYVIFTRRVSFAETNLDTSASATGAEIQNSGTLIRAGYFGEATDITVQDCKRVFREAEWQVLQGPSKFFSGN